MALRDRLAKPQQAAIPAIPAILRAESQPEPSKIATIATIASAPTIAPRFWRFDVRYPDGSGFEARTLPEATEAEARELWPGASVRALEADQ